MFKVGDYVIYTPNNIKAKIIKVFLGGLRYTVEFDDPNLIPPQMDIPANYLAPIEPGILPHGNNSLKEIYCPKCGNKWKETLIGRQLFYDCLKCNLKKEDA